MLGVDVVLEIRHQRHAGALLALVQVGQEGGGEGLLRQCLARLAVFYVSAVVAQQQSAVVRHL